VALADAAQVASLRVRGLTQAVQRVEIAAMAARANVERFFAAEHPGRFFPDGGGRFFGPEDQTRFFPTTPERFVSSPGRFVDTPSRFNPSPGRFVDSPHRFTPSPIRFTPSATRFSAGGRFFDGTSPTRFFPGSMTASQALADSIRRGQAPQLVQAIGDAL
jgi:hypothetical protein